MPNCRNCAAPIAAGSIVCRYCGTRNDIDLRGVHEYTVKVPESERTCPRCNRPLQTVDLGIEGTFMIERCEKCLGLFFDPGELEALLRKSVDHVYDIDYKGLNVLANTKRHDEFAISYVKCPVCTKLMNRTNFGARSGVIVDRCGDHGVWLDGGELRQLLEWTKSGGLLLDQQAAQRKAAEQERADKRKERERQMRRQSEHSATFTSTQFHSRPRARVGEDLEGRLLGMLAKAAAKLLM